MATQRWENGSKNEVVIDGILSEVKLQEGTDTNGNPAIYGEYKIKTTNVIDGIEYKVEIPVRVYQSKTTSKGKDNPAYATAQKIMKDYVSIAAGGEEKATAIRLPEKSTSIQENFFMSKNTNQMVYSSGIRASFANEISRSDMNPGARFKVIMVIGEISHEVDKNEEETGRLVIKGVLPQWGGKVDVVPFIVANRRVADHIEKNWQRGDTVLVGGYINYTSTIVEEPVDETSTFGEVMTSQKTKSVREYIITGGHEEPLTEEEGAYSQDLIAEALQERQAKIEEKKADAPKKKTPTFGF